MLEGAITRLASVRVGGLSRRHRPGKLALPTRERRRRSCANSYARQDTYGEGAMGVRRGTLRAGMERGTEAVGGILREGCGREAMPVPGGTACTSQRRRRDADTGELTPYAAGAALSAGSALATALTQPLT